MIMHILNVFDKYFLIMMIILGTIAIIADSARIKKDGNNKKSKFVKAFGLAVIVVSLGLFIVHNIYS